MGEYFIKIEDAPDVRRKILESSKATLHMLRGYQELLKTRSEKLTQINHLRQELKVITLLVNRAERLMPMMSTQEITRVLPAKKAGKAVKPIPAPTQVIPVQQVYFGKKGSKKVLPPIKEQKAGKPKLSDIASLEEQLAALEKKLGDV